MSTAARATVEHLRSFVTACLADAGYAGAGGVGWGKREEMGRVSKKKKKKKRKGEKKDRWSHLAKWVGAVPSSRSLKTHFPSVSPFLPPPFNFSLYISSLSHFPIFTSSFFFLSLSFSFFSRGGCRGRVCPSGNFCAGTIRAGRARHLYTTAARRRLVLSRRRMRK